MNIADNPQKEKRKMFSRTSISLPAVINTERITHPIPLRRCVTMFNDIKDETETDTSESHSEHSAVITTRSRFEEITRPILECTAETSTANEFSDSSTKLAPAIKVEEVDQEEGEEEMGDEKLPLVKQGVVNNLYTPLEKVRPISPALSNASEETIIPEHEELGQIAEAREEGEVTGATTKVIVPRRQRLIKMKSAVLYCSLNNASYKSPFYIVTPKLRFHRKRSSSMPLLYKPTLVRSKLRRAVTDSPHSLSNIIEEYDADLDDDELVVEQEELETRICDSIIKSITNSSKEDLLQQIEDRVEGTSDEALRIKKNGRKKKASFSKSGDEWSQSSSDKDQGPGDGLLSVKPRRKRKRSRSDRRPVQDGSQLSASVSQGDTQSLRTEMENTDTCRDFPTASELSQSDFRTAPGSQSDLAAGPASQSESATACNGRCSPRLEKISDASVVANYTDTVESVVENGEEGEEVKFDIPLASSVLLDTEENLGDIVKQELGAEEDPTLSSGSVEDWTDGKSRSEWELQVLRDVIKHFEEDLAESEQILEEKKQRDRRIRMEIKMLRTQIAVHEMDQRLRSEFKPQHTSTPRPGKVPKEAAHKLKNRTAFDSFLLAEK